MKPQIRYARTTDGVSIAYTVTGSGPTVIHMPEQPFSHQLLWPEVFPDAYASMALWFRTVRYDVRGSGMSDRDVIDFSLEAMLRDLDAVVNATAEGTFALLATFDSVPVAITYAARHPERVTHLALADGYISFADYEAGQALGIERALREQDWAISTEILAGALGGFEGEEATNFAQYIRACVDKPAYKASQEAIEAYDVSALLDKVEAQTLVLQTRSNRWLPADTGRRLASRIRTSQLEFVDEPLLKGFPAILREFMAIPVTASNDPVGGGPSLRTVLFTDIVGHTEMMQRLGDVKGRDVLRDHERITRDTLKQHGGAEVKTMGDGFMAWFGSVTRALECAVALQRAFAVHTEKEGEPLHVRVGLNAGEPIEEDGDLFGATVILAARIAAKADGGEILIPEPVRHLLSGKAFVFSDRGEFAMKGFDDAVRLYEVRWQG
ncbi:MAG: adenylate/guanylate cyclase domain-containing protein [Anaerolineaceae bacterium]